MALHIVEAICATIVALAILMVILAVAVKPKVERMADPTPTLDEIYASAKALIGELSESAKA